MRGLSTWSSPYRPLTAIPVRANRTVYIIIFCPPGRSAPLLRTASSWNGRRSIRAAITARCAARWTACSVRARTLSWTSTKGALNVKQIYGDRARTIFVEPPSIDELRARLEGRGTDDAERIAVRISRARYELSLAPEFDTRVINDNLQEAIAETTGIIAEFLAR